MDKESAAGGGKLQLIGRTVKLDFVGWPRSPLVWAGQAARKGVTRGAKTARTLLLLLRSSSQRAARPRRIVLYLHLYAWRKVGRWP